MLGIMICEMFHSKVNWLAACSHSLADEIYLPSIRIWRITLYPFKKFLIEFNHFLNLEMPGSMNPENLENNA